MATIYVACIDVASATIAVVLPLSTHNFRNTSRTTEIVLLGKRTSNITTSVVRLRYVQATLMAELYYRGQCELQHPTRLLRLQSPQISIICQFVIKISLKKKWDLSFALYLKQSEPKIS